MTICRASSLFCVLTTSVLLSPLAAVEPKLGSSVSVRAFSLRVGHMELKMTGDLSPIQLDSKPTGCWFFKGMADFTYTSEEPCEQLLIKANLKGCALTGRPSPTGTRM